MAKPSILIALSCLALAACGGGQAEQVSQQATQAEPVRNSKSNPWSNDAPNATTSNKVAVGGGSSSSASSRLAANRARAAGPQQAGGGGTVSLKRQSDGHFYADIDVNSQILNVLVDTGASIVALTGGDAQDLGLDWNPSEVRPIGRGASGDVYGVPVMLEEMDLGGIRARNVSAVIVPDGLDVTLLGQSFLSQIDKVEISGDTMVLTD